MKSITEVSNTSIIEESDSGIQMIKIPPQINLLDQMYDSEFI